MRATRVVLLLGTLVSLSACSRRALPLTGDGLAPADAASGLDTHELDPRSCAENKHCLSGQYCHLDGLCVAVAGGLGECRPRPESCPDYVQCPEVCGCDGKTYCDACDAHAHGISVATKRACFAPTCAGLEAAYAAEIKKAKQCCATCGALSCMSKVPGTLACGCDTAVDTRPPALAAIRKEFLDRGCKHGVPLCTGGCPEVTQGLCKGDPGTPNPGSCVDIP